MGIMVVSIFLIRTINPRSIIFGNNVVSKSKQHGGLGGGIKSHLRSFVRTSDSDGKSKTTTIDPATSSIASSSLVMRNLLESAGISITDEILSQLPPYSEVAKLYGSKPIIQGLDTCQTFQNTVQKEKAYIAPAGMFNSGTHLINRYLTENCVMPRKASNDEEDASIRFQVPWGKHWPASYRLNRIVTSSGHGKGEIAAGGEGIVQTDVLPIVMIKDPFTWMLSMCRNPYSVSWLHRSDQCPQLSSVKDKLKRTKNMARRGIYEHTLKESANNIHRESNNDGDGKIERQEIPVHVNYNATLKVTYSSLVGLWNDWYREWNDVTFPRLIIRYEDLLFHPEKVTTQICTCAGGEMKVGGANKRNSPTESFKPVAQGAKTHGGQSGLTAAIIRYGDLTKRVKGYSDYDLKHASMTLDSELLQKFQYPLPPPRLKEQWHDILY
eukprot:CAMPEP_0195529574 /NCGR_PEP_ID=MMETSP0794_2-20130614/32172_1 /TAXON_ID=515487 /ORGANISM="Stephanopyxis turris, Strain CCMP 815" /LENGTH=438 /DNA_ID=CAMNT_0040660897 /DNA_START=236 /DNA_END=1552 /DNA_ORIENTATION=-